MKKTILVLATTFPSLSEMDPSKKGGHFLHANCLCLVHAGYAVHVLAPLRKDLPREESGHGISVTRFAYPFMEYTPVYNHHALYGFRNSRDVFLTALMFFAYVRQIQKYIKHQAVDLIWANWLQVGLAAYLAAGSRVPILTSLRGSDVRNMPTFLTRLITWKVRDIFNMHADEEIKGWIEKFHLNEIRVPDVYKKSVGASLERQCAAHTVVVIGRLENNEYHLKHKGIGDQLFSVLRRVIKEYRDLSVIVIGDGSQGRHFQSLCSDLAKNITFLGWKNEFDEYLQDASLVIGASGLAGVTLDTVPFGIPVIISKYDPAAFFWKHEQNCLMYNPLSEDDFYSAIEFALNNPAMLKQYAKNAEGDIRKYALPVNDASCIWRDKIETFIARSS